jgi:5-methylcytosine-specific restriction endonuclease McrA
MNARVTGCTTCANVSRRLQPNRRQPQAELSPEEILRRREVATRTERERSALRAAYNHISNRNDLREYLNQENNAYSNFILSKLDQQEGSAGSGAVEGTTFEMHHIIPRHAGGPDSQWNLIRLTVADHIRAHRIRYEVYNEFGDYNCTRAADPTLPINEEYEARRVEGRARGNQTRLTQQSGIYAPGASAAGGRASAAVNSIQRLYTHQNQMDELTRAALYKGCTWYHPRTNITLVVTGRQALTLTHLKILLAAALPEGSQDRISLTRNTNNNNITSSISKVIRGQRPTAYGWRLISIVSNPTLSESEDTEAD